jgi:hypothetical protein
MTVEYSVRQRSARCKKVVDVGGLVWYYGVTYPRLWSARSNAGFLVGGVK